MIILDTNVVSEGFRLHPNQHARTWLDAQLPSDLFLCAPVLAELRYGIERLPQGRRRAELDRLVANAEQGWFRNRLLLVDREAAHEFGRIVARRARTGRPIALMDALIAAVALANHMMIATRDVRDFIDVGVNLINPFDAITAR